jgi:hypothetical protein
MMAKAVDVVRVISSVVGDEQAKRDGQEEPAKRITRLAAGDHHSHARTRDADDQGHEPIAELAGEQGQRKRRHQEQDGQPARRRCPGRVTAAVRCRWLSHGDYVTAAPFRERYRDTAASAICSSFFG